MIHQQNIYGKDKVQVAIERLQAFEPPEGYWLAFSGGKDSVVIKALADMAGVKYDAHYNITSVDPPELVQFIKTFKDVKIEKPRDKEGKHITMWNLIPKKTMPPTRTVRYCCQYLKEGGGEGRFTVTGVRWDESSNRKNNQASVTIYKPKAKEKQELIKSGNFSPNSSGGVILNNDNEESRKMVEQCYRLTKTVLNPIIDWTTAEVWEFIHEYKIPYCKLYDEGYSRLGCIGCPMGSKQQEELTRYPKYKKAYIKAFDKMLEQRKDPADWKTGEEVMSWWIGEQQKQETTEQIQIGEEK